MKDESQNKTQAHESKLRKRIHENGTEENVVDGHVGEKVADCLTRIAHRRTLEHITNDSSNGTVLFGISSHVKHKVGIDVLFLYKERDLLRRSSVSARNGEEVTGPMASLVSTVSRISSCVPPFVFGAADRDFSASASTK